MGAMEQVTCARCDQPFERTPPSQATECATCLKLGDRSLVWYQRAVATATSQDEKDQLRRRFDAARGRGWMQRDIEHVLDILGAAGLPPGLIQRAREGRQRGT